MSFRKIFSLLGVLFGLWPLSGTAQEPQPVVHAILFYSPTCPHCHDVITNNLIPLQNEYGRRLVILGMDTSQRWANEIFWAALRHYQVPEERWAVPFMIVGDEILVGGNEIPARLPVILDEGLASGGIDLPDLPELLEFMSEQGLLDDRYPDRRIALQSPQEPSPGEGATAGAEEEVAGASDPEGARDSVPEASADSIPAVGPEPEEEETEARDMASGAERPPHDSLSRPDIPVDSATEAESGLAGGSGPGGEPGDSTSAPTSAGSSAAPRPSGAGETPPGERGKTGGGLGLGDAATRLGSMTMWDRFNQDPAGNSLSVLVLLGMVVSLLLTGRPGRVRRGPWPAWVIPALVVLGVGVASYLSFVEVTQVEAVCGPVGDCNTVNQSEYATLFGVLPVGVLGLMGYALILTLWGLGIRGPEYARRPARLGLWGAALFGVAFSIYLTFLEPFVIGATCAWCLSSAVIMTLLLWASAPLAAQVWPGREEYHLDSQA